MKDNTKSWWTAVVDRFWKFMDFLISESIVAQTVFALIVSTLFAGPGWYLLLSGHTIVGVVLLAVTFLASLVILGTLGVWKSTVPFIIAGLWTRLIITVLSRFFGEF